MATIARGANREEAAAPPTRFLAKRRVHNVGAATHSNWTRTSNRGTKRGDWLGPSEHRGGHRGSGGRSSRPSPRLPRQLTRPHAYAQAEEAVDADGSMDAQTRPQLLAKPRRRGFARAPTAIIFFVIRRPERKDRREKSRFLRFYLASDNKHLMPDNMHDIHPEHPLSEPQIPRSDKSATGPQVAYFPSGVWPTF